MNRRNFMRSLIGGVVATAAVKAWPYRVYSFPSQLQTDDLAVIYAKIQQGYAEFPYGFISFGGARGGGRTAAMQALALANGNTIKFNLHPAQHDLLLGGPNVTYDGPVYG